MKLSSILLSLLLLASLLGATHAFTFNISEDGSTLLKDGTPTRVISGSFHYFRVPSAEWPQRFATMAASGLNSVQTYIAWNVHCPLPNAPCDFSGDRNLSYFFQLAQEHGLQVLLRPGPYICAEWDLGGFPAWLLPLIGAQRLRTSDPLYLKQVHNWWTVLLPIVKPYLYVVNGGPIVMVQVENEYGSFSNDAIYLTYLRDLLLTELGSNVLLYSTDANFDNNIQNTAIPGVFQAVDFFYYGWTDQNVPKAWETQHSAVNKNSSLLRGPNFNDEFYPGWFTSWFDPFVKNHTVQHVANLTHAILDTTISGESNLNFYMFFGGSNFGYWPGFRVTTSYDYGAPMNESGHVTPLFTALAPMLRAASRMPVPNSVPQPPPLVSYGTVQLTQYASLWNTRVMEWLASKVVYVKPNETLPTMESLGQSAGMMMYEFQVRQNVTSIALNPYDYAVVVMDGVVVGTIVRNVNLTITLPQSRYVDTVWILVDHDGRPNDWMKGTPTELLSKGLIGGVLVNGNLTSFGFMIYTFPLTWEMLLLNTPWQNLTKPTAPINAGGVYYGTFQVSAPQGAASLLDVSGAMPGSFPFGRGYAYLNGHALGRYWPTAGPQTTLYVPHSFLCQTLPCNNTLILVEIGKSVLKEQNVVSFKN